MWPSPLAFMTGAHSLVSRNAEVTFTVITRWNSSSEQSSIGFRLSMPALLNSTSTVP